MGNGTLLGSWENFGAARTQAFPSRVLIAGSDETVARLLSGHLREPHFEIDFVSRGLHCLEKVFRESFAIVVLDWPLLDMSGFEVLSRIRTRLSIPILVLTAAGRNLDKIVGLEIGADDCLEKPFDVRELTARIKAILRRAYSFPKSAPLIVDGVRLDIAKRIVSCDGIPIELTASEFEVLKMLLGSAGKVVSREELCRLALGREPSPLDRSLDNHISRVRSKLGVSGGRIRTIRGVGYLYAL